MQFDSLSLEGEGVRALASFPLLLKGERRTAVLDGDYLVSTH
jgi:hypothetical protein